MAANEMLSDYFGSVFFEILSIIDFEDKIIKFGLKFLFTDASFIEEMENEFLWIRELFSYGIQKYCLFIS